MLGSLVASYLTFPSAGPRRQGSRGPACAAGHIARGPPFSPSVRRLRGSQVRGDVLRQHAAVLRSAPRLIPTKCAQKPASFSGIARDVHAHLQLDLIESPFPRIVVCVSAVPLVCADARSTIIKILFGGTAAPNNLLNLFETGQKGHLQSLQYPRLSCVYKGRWRSYSA